MELPTQKTKVISRFQNQDTLIYGPPKVGKSKLGSLYKNALFFATEPGLKSLSVYQLKIKNWEDFIQGVKLLKKEKKKHKFKRAIIDTADNLYRFCKEYVCTKAGISHPADDEWGKGWDMVATEFNKQILVLMNLGLGIIYISHSQEREIKTRVDKVTKTIPTLTGQARGLILPAVDIVIYLGYRLKVVGGRTVNQRIAICRGRENIEAGDRTKKLPRKPITFDTEEELMEIFTNCFRKGDLDEN